MTKIFNGESTDITIVTDLGSIIIHTVWLIPKN